MAQTAPSNEAMKQTLKEALAEALHEQRELLREIFAEVLEDFALTEAIREGRQTGCIERRGLRYPGGWIVKTTFQRSFGGI